MGDPARLREAFSLQYQTCRGLGAEVAAALLDRARRDAEAGGPIAALFAGVDVDPIEGRLPLRLLASVHRAVLAGRAPELEPHFPTTGGHPDVDLLGDLLVGLVEREAEQLRAQLVVPPRSNDLAHAGVLFAGLLTIWQRTGLPLQLYELGARAGLHLLLDRFHYRLGILEWGEAHSPVRLRPRWSGDFLAEPETPLVIAERAGCDREPIDATDPEATLQLCARVWPDHPHALDRLRAAIALARQHPVSVARDDAVDWLADRLETMRPGVGTVVLQCLLERGLDREERAELVALIEEAAERARIGRPLAWLRLEREDPVLRLRLRIWPAGRGRDELLAEAHPQGRWIRWNLRGIRPLIEEMDD